MLYFTLIISLNGPALHIATVMGEERTLVLPALRVLRGVRVEEYVFPWDVPVLERGSFQHFET